MKQTSSRLIKLLPWFLLGLSLAFSLFIYARYGLHSLDADQSSEFVLAAHLNQKKAFLSTDWYYSTELRTVSPVPIYQLGLALFPSWHTARLFSILVIAVATTASFLFAARQAGCHEEAVYCAACFILPFSKVHSFLFSWGGFYSMYLIFGCLAFGIILSLRHSTYRIPKFILLILLGVWFGTAGIRVFMIFSVPFVCAAFLTPAQAAPAPLFENSRTFWLPAASVLFLISNLAGYLINLLVLSPLYHFKQYDRIITKPFRISEFWDHIDALVTYFGYKNESTFISLDGGIGFLLIVLAFAVIIVPAILIRKPSLPPVQKIIPWFALSGILFLWIIDGMAEGYSASPYAVGYYLMSLLFALLSIFLLIQHLNLSVGMRALLMLCMTALFYGNTISFVRRDIPSRELDQEKATAWLIENGYTTGYATFWNGNLLTELSDGKLEMITFATWKSQIPYRWLQTVQHVSEIPEGKVFLYTDVDEIDYSPSPCMSDGLLVYSEGNVRIYAFDDAHVIYTKQLSQYEAPSDQLLPDQIRSLP